MNQTLQDDLNQSSSSFNQSKSKELKTLKNSFFSFPAFKIYFLLFCFSFATFNAHSATYTITSNSNWSSIFPRPMPIDVIIDEYEGVKLIARELVAQNADECIKYLGLLNGGTISQAVFSLDGNDLMIGGGPDGYVLSTWNDVEGEGYLLRNKLIDAGDEQKIVSGGQGGMWDLANILDRATVDLALAEFSVTGSRNSNLIWIKDE